MAEIAQNHSERCVFQHNYNLDSQSDSFDMIGETIAAVAGIGTARSLVLYWFNQTDAYSYESNTCSGVCSTYRQVKPTYRFQWCTKDTTFISIVHYGNEYT